LSHRAILVVFSGLMLGMLLAALDQTIISTALPTIVGELGGLDHLSWVVTAYLLTSTVSVPLYGKLSDLYGRRIVFQAAIAIFLVGSVLSGAAQSMGQLIFFRGIQGTGAGGIFATAMAIIGDIVPPRQRGKYQGFIGAVFAFASVVGPLAGGFFVDGPGWRWVFYINAPLGAVALVVTSTALRFPFQTHPHKVDYLGAALLVSGVSALLLVTVWGGNEFAWSSPLILGLSAAGVALLVLFAWWETRAAEPILPLRLFRNDILTTSLVLGFLMGFAMFGTIVFLPVYLQAVTGASATDSGLLLLPLMFGIVITSIGSGRMITATGRYKIFPIAGNAFMALGLFLLSTMDRTTPRWESSLWMFLVGAGIGLVMQVLVIAAQNAVAHRDRHVAQDGVRDAEIVGKLLKEGRVALVLQVDINTLASLSYAMCELAAAPNLVRDQLAGFARDGQLGLLDEVHDLGIGEDRL
jgi:EmrB/QacA subfamily drug resistance transporter